MKERSICKEKHRMKLLELGDPEVWLCERCKKIYSYKISKDVLKADAGDLVV